VPPKSWPYAGDSNSFKKIIREEEGLPMWDNIDFEIDLMVEKPEAVISDWITAGASRIVVHVESTKAVGEIVRQFNEWFAYGDAKSRDIELGLALNIDTPLDAVTSHLEDIDFVQFMGITPIGYQGEVFDERVLDKIREFHNEHPEVVISVDGGVNLETAPRLVEAGAKRLISGSAIFESGDIGGAIERFKKLF
jgi:ribulose-phosphate 3-epimerase